MMKVLIVYRRLTGGFFTRELECSPLQHWGRNILQSLKDETHSAPALRRADVVAVRIAGGWHWPPLPKTSMRVLYQLKRELEARGC